MAWWVAMTVCLTDILSEWLGWTNMICCYVALTTADCEWHTFGGHNFFCCCCWRCWLYGLKQMPGIYPCCTISQQRIVIMVVYSYTYRKSYLSHILHPYIHTYIVYCRLVCLNIDRSIGISCVYVGRMMYKCLFFTYVCVCRYMLTDNTYR